MSDLLILCRDCNGRRVVFDEDTHRTKYPCATCKASGVEPRPSEWNDDPRWRLPDGKGFDFLWDTETGRRYAAARGWQKKKEEL